MNVAFSTRNKENRYIGTFRMINLPSVHNFTENSLRCMLLNNYSEFVPSGRQPRSMKRRTRNLIYSVTLFSMISGWNGEMIRNICSMHKFREYISWKPFRVIMIISKRKKICINLSFFTILSQLPKVDSTVRNNIFTNPVAHAKIYDSID